jgi:aromatic-L-amino-acid/L-tryptophan decarboxylase
VIDGLAAVPDRPVFPPIEPGSLADLFPAVAPEMPEPLAAILADHRALIEPNATQWQHPGFMAYFPTSASSAGMIGELLMTALA